MLDQYQKQFLCLAPLFPSGNVLIKIKITPLFIYSETTEFRLQIKQHKTTTKFTNRIIPRCIIKTSVLRYILPCCLFGLATENHPRKTGWKAEENLWPESAFLMQRHVNHKLLRRFLFFHNVLSACRDGCKVFLVAVEKKVVCGCGNLSFWLNEKTKLRWNHQKISLRHQVYWSSSTNMKICLYFIRQMINCGVTPLSAISWAVAKVSSRNFPELSQRNWERALNCLICSC